MSNLLWTIAGVLAAIVGTSALVLGNWGLAFVMIVVVVVSWFNYRTSFPC